MHHRYCLILKLIVNCLAAYRLPFVLEIINTRHIFYSLFTIYRTQFKLSELCYVIMISYDNKNRSILFFIKK
jgi:hypothetical protein